MSEFLSALLRLGTYKLVCSVINELALLLNIVHQYTAILQCCVYGSIVCRQHVSVTSVGGLLCLPLNDIHCNSYYYFIAN